MGELMKTFRMLQHACSLHEHDELLVLLKSLVPESKIDIPVPLS